MGKKPVANKTHKKKEMRESHARLRKMLGQLGVKTDSQPPSKRELEEFTKHHSSKTKSKLAPLSPEMKLVKSFILKEAETWEDDQTLAAFYRWQADSLQEITASSDPPTDRRTLSVLDQFSKIHGSFRPLRCFENAINLSECGLLLGTNVGYVEGYYLQVFGDGRRVLYSHAWNSIKRRHLDMTESANRLAQSKHKTLPYKAFHFKIVEFHSTDALSLAEAVNGEIQIPYFCSLNSLPTNALARGWKIVESISHI